jgi:chromosome segregation ATPase
MPLDFGVQIATLKSENAALQQKLASASATPQAGAGAGSAEQAAEIAKLQAKVKKLEEDLAQDDLKAMISNFSQGTQQDLEKERAELQSRCTMAEEQLEQMNEYMQESTANYQQEIMRLRGLLEANGLSAD